MIRMDGQVGLRPAMFFQPTEVLRKLNAGGPRVERFRVIGHKGSLAHELLFGLGANQLHTAPSESPAVSLATIATSTDPSPATASAPPGSAPLPGTSCRSPAPAQATVAHDAFPGECRPRSSRPQHCEAPGPSRVRRE